MNKKDTLILFFIITCQFLLFAQEVEELKFIKEEKIKDKYYKPGFALLDYKGNFVSELNTFYSEKGLMVDFKIDDVDFSFDMFLYANVNKEANRIYTFGRNPLPADCGGNPCSIRGFKIYDLKGNLIKIDSTIFTSTFGGGYTISDNGDFYITKKSLISDSLLLTKYNLNGVLQWEQKLAISSRMHSRISIQIRANEIIAVSASDGYPHAKVLILKGDSGQKIWEKELSSYSKIVLFNENDIVINNRLSISHFSLKKDTTFIIHTFPSQFIFISSDIKGKFFGGFTRSNSKTEIPLIIFKKIKEEYVLFKKVDLSKYNFTKESSNIIRPFINSIFLDDKGGVIISCLDKKLFFK